MERVVRYGLVGVINSLAGLAVIAALDLGLRAPPALANAAGYAVGVVISYGLNRRFVFDSRTSPRATGPRFLIAAMGSYTLALFLACQFWVFLPSGRRRASAGAAGIGRREAPSSGRT